MSGVLLWVVCPKGNGNSVLSILQKSNNNRERRSRRVSICSEASALSSAIANPATSSEEKVYEVVLKQAALVKESKLQRALDIKKPEDSTTDSVNDKDLLNEAYDRCGEVCAEYAKTFYLGIFLFPISVVYKRL